MAKVSTFSMLSKAKQTELLRLTDALSCYPELLLPPEIIDDDLHDKYIEEINNGADPDTTIDEGVYQRVNTDALIALIELLGDLRIDSQAADKAFENIYKKREKMEKKEKPDVLVEVGDIVTFTMGTGKNKVEYTRPVKKLTDNTFHVEFTEDYPCSNSDKPIGVRYIKYANIVRNETAVQKGMGNAQAPAEVAA